MCPRPINAAKIPINVELENLIVPKKFDEEEAGKQKKSACFYIADDEEEDYSSDDDVYCGQESKLEESIATNNARLREEENQCYLENKLIIEPKQLQVCSQEELIHPTEHLNRNLTSALKKPSSLSSGSKKSVRFADSVGLDLTHVKLFRSNLNFFDQYFDLDYLLPSPTTRMNIFANWKEAATVKTEQRQLSLSTPLLRKEEEIYEIAEAQNVCIESITCKGMSVSGTVQVKNTAHENEQVQIRYTLNGWKTYSETECIFALSKGDNHDSFSFSFFLSSDLPVGSCCEMCAYFSTEEQSFWDNNNGKNYILNCCQLSSSQDDDASSCATTQKCAQLPKASCKEVQDTKSSPKTVHTDFFLKSAVERLLGLGTFAKSDSNLKERPGALFWKVIEMPYLMFRNAISVLFFFYQLNNVE
uniref:CBM21 domain-containing protein n=1 Tax=Plectus sambesii TaxID=2011161 RepID=A0A914WXB7_9BILA